MSMGNLFMSSYSVPVEWAEAGWETVEMSPVKIYLRKRRRETDEGRSPNRWGEAFSLKCVVLTTPGPGTSCRLQARGRNKPRGLRHDHPYCEAWGETDTQVCRMKDSQLNGLCFKTTIIIITLIFLSGAVSSHLLHTFTSSFLKILLAPLFLVSSPTDDVWKSQASLLCLPLCLTVGAAAKRLSVISLETKTHTHTHFSSNCIF